MITYIGYDKDDVPRVYGTAEDESAAMEECGLAIQEYIRDRPDAGPMSSWSFHRKERGPI